MTSVPAAGVPDSLERLVELALRGDERAFALIVRRHHVDMVRVAYVVSGSPDMAEEAVAAAWPLAWRRLASLRDADRLRPWLCSIAANEARAVARRRGRDAVREVSVEHLADDAGHSAVADTADRARDLDLADALARLAPADRALLALRYVAGLNSTELGRATGMTPSGTRARLGRLLDRLRKDLGDD